ncbi:MAG TPA: TlpA disulfide reductase family protein [Bdellovibrionota bacterium]|jgi:thiol-disulfide isomerase/thioredoxin|nr:TlpA disulfide reductase family protein [Bdellovibrionota bacterium]
MNPKLKSIISGYWWTVPLLILVIFMFAQAFIPEKPAFENRLETRINLGIKMDTASGDFLPITAILQGKLSAEDDQSTQHRFILLSMWATWCAPCIKELPRLSAAKERLKIAGILPLLVNYDSGDKQKVVAEISAWLVAHSVNLPTVYDFNSSLSAALDVSALPFSLLLDRNGNILWMHMGELQDEDLANLIGTYKNK